MRAARTGWVFTDWGIRHGINLNAELVRDSSQLFTGNFANDERAAIEFASGSFERLFGGFHLDVFQTITQRHEGVIGVVIDQVDRATARDTSGRAHVAFD